MLAFTLCVSLVGGALLGLVPTLQSTQPEVPAPSGARVLGGGQRGHLRWRNALVVAQLTIEPRATVMKNGRRLGFEPIEREFEKLGYDSERRAPSSDRLRFIELKGARRRGRDGHRDPEGDPLQS